MYVFCMLFSILVCITVKIQEEVLCVCAKIKKKKSEQFWEDHLARPVFWGTLFRKELSRIIKVIHTIPPWM